MRSCKVEDMNERVHEREIECNEHVNRMEDNGLLKIAREESDATKDGKSRPRRSSRYHRLRKKRDRTTERERERERERALTYTRLCKIAVLQERYSRSLDLIVLNSYSRVRLSRDAIECAIKRVALRSSLRRASELIAST